MQVNSQKVSLESLAVSDCGPEIGRELVPSLQCQNKEELSLLCNLCLLLTIGRPAVVVERSTRAGECGLTNAWR